MTACFLVIPAVGSLSTSVQADNTRPGDLDINARTIFGITLGKANLTSVQAKLGRAKVWGDGDASSAESKVCYFTRGADSLVITFAANAEMSPNGEITDVRVVRRAGYKNQSYCQPLNTNGDQVRTGSGLKLGVTPNEVRLMMGKPSRSNRVEWDYAWSIDRSIPQSDKSYQYWLARRQECFEGKEPYYTTLGGILIRFNGGVVDALSLTRYESLC